MSYKEVRAKTGEDKDGKPFYKTIGRVVDTAKGQSLKLDLIPLGWDGWAMLMDPLPKEGRRSRSDPDPNSGYETAGDADIPF